MRRLLPLVALLPAPVLAESFERPVPAGRDRRRRDLLRARRARPRPRARSRAMAGRPSLSARLAARSPPLYPFAAGAAAVNLFFRRWS